MAEEDKPSILHNHAPMLGREGSAIGHGVSALYLPSSGAQPGVQAPRVVLSDTRYKAKDTLRFYCSMSGDMLHSAPCPYSPALATFTDPETSSPRVAAGTDTGTVLIFNGDDFTLCHQVDTGPRAIYGLALYVDPEGRTCLAALVSSGTIHVISTSEGLLLRSFPCGLRAAEAPLAFSGADGRARLAVGGSDTLTICDPDTGAVLRTIPCAPGGGPSVLVHATLRGGEGGPDQGVLIASGGREGLIEAFAAEDGGPLHRLSFSASQDARARRVLAMTTYRTASGEDRLAARGADQSIRVWDMPEFTLLQTIHDPQATLARGTLLAFQLAGGASRLLSACIDPYATRLWDPESGILLHTLRRHRSRVTVLNLVTTEESRHLFVAGDEMGGFTTWDLGEAPPYEEPPLPGAPEAAQLRRAGKLG
jgi:WD40 repeat protein